ncbi:MAG TPA: plastocyanin/azurin family copper-binding protein [Gemmatimonadaceae bacterium]
MRVAPYVLVAAVLLGCGGGGGDGTGPNLTFTSLAVTPTTATIVGAPGGTTTLAAVPQDQNGHPMSGLGTPNWTSSDETIATVNGSGVVTSVAIGGPVTITASLTANGVTKQGTAQVTVADIPTTAGVTATDGNAFTPQTVDIKAGGTVTWTFQSTTHNVTFNDPSQPGTPSDIPNKSSTTASLTFPQPGTYAYHCTIHGPSMSGTVVVH